MCALHHAPCRKQTASRPNLQEHQVPVSPCIAYKLSEDPTTDEPEDEDHEYEQVI